MVFPVRDSSVFPMVPYVFKTQERQMIRTFVQQGNDEVMARVLADPISGENRKMV